LDIEDIPFFERHADHYVAPPQANHSLLESWAALGSSEWPLFYETTGDSYECLMGMAVEIWRGWEPHSFPSPLSLETVETIALGLVVIQYVVGALQEDSQEHLDLIDTEILFEHRLTTPVANRSLFVREQYTDWIGATSLWFRAAFRERAGILMPGPLSMELPRPLQAADRTRLASRLSGARAFLLSSTQPHPPLPGGEVVDDVLDVYTISALVGHFKQTRVSILIRINRELSLASVGVTDPPGGELRETIVWNNWNQ